MESAACAGDDKRVQRRIGPVFVDVLSRTDAIGQILAAIDLRRQLLVAFCNAHTVNVAASDRQFVSALDQALVLNDGVGLELASRMLHGEGFPANLNGTDFIPALLERAGGALRIYLLGSRSSVVGRAAAALQQAFPRHQVVGASHGFFADAEGDAVARRISESRPDLVLVGMGQPRQELWAVKHFRNFPGPTVCVGAFLDFAAGAIPRAPRWVRTARMEWAFRLGLEPRRLARRYLIGNPQFMLRVLLDRLRGRSDQ